MEEAACHPKSLRRSLEQRRPRKDLPPLSLTGTGGVERLVFGSIDLSWDLGIAGDGDELNFFRSQLVRVS
jgi:hypothetical protein